MKVKSILLTVFLLLMISYTQAQNKKDCEKDLNACTAKSDSLNKALTGLGSRYDSLNTGYQVYNTMYGTISSKLSLGDFDPAKMGTILDSLKSSHEADLAGVESEKEALRDSVKYFSMMADSLGTEAGHLKYIVSRYIIKGTIPLNEKEFTGSWAFFTQYYEVVNDSLMNGLILMPAPSDFKSLSRIVFVDQEIAELTLSNGESLKCFYKIKSFSKDKPYVIELSKGSELNINLVANHTREGDLQISFKKDNGYFQGYMRKQ